MGGVPEPGGEPGVVLADFLVLASANLFVWRATDPLSGMTYTLRLVATGLGYGVDGLPNTGSVSRLDLRTQTPDGGDVQTFYHLGMASPASLGPLLDPLSWVGTAEPVRPVLAMRSGVPVTHIDRATSYTKGSAQSDIISAVRGLVMRAEGGAGGDTVSGSAGNDTLDGQDDNDLVAGGMGDDSLAGGADDDTLRGGTGDDRLDGGFHNDDLHGGVGHDVLLGGFGLDHIFAGDGNDSADGGTGDD